MLFQDPFLFKIENVFGQKSSEFYLFISEIWAIPNETQGILLVLSALRVLPGHF